jgi:hypothetical protein
MSRRKTVTRVALIALSTTTILAPFASADQSTGIAAVSAAVPLAGPAPGSLRLASMVDSSRSTTALDYARFARSQATEPTPPPPVGAGTWTKTGKTLTIIGGAVAAAGGVMVAAGSSEVEDVTIDWRTTGYVWIGAGVVLMIIGLTRRH